MVMQNISHNSLICCFNLKPTNKKRKRTFVKITPINPINNYCTFNLAIESQLFFACFKRDQPIVTIKIKLWRSWYKHVGSVAQRLGIGRHRIKGCPMSAAFSRQSPA